MSNYKIKLCGINDLEILNFCLNYSYKPDFLGFVFFEKSPRHINLKQAKLFNQAINGQIKKIAVTVNPTLAEIAAINENLEPDYLQLHGNESLEFIAEIKQSFDFKIIKAIAVANSQDIDHARSYISKVDYLLLDTKTILHGGSGEKFDWKLIADDFNDYILSGGLDQSSIAQAIKQTNAKIFDLSSSIELQKGVKDPKKIAEILDFFKELNEKTTT